MPFSLQEMAQISSVLKELCVGLIELAFPDSSPDFRSTFRHDVQNRASKDPITMSMWPRLFKVRMLKTCCLGRNLTMDPRRHMSFSIGSGSSDKTIAFSRFAKTILSGWYVGIDAHINDEIRQASGYSICDT